MLNCEVRGQSREASKAYAQNKTKQPHIIRETDFGNKYTKKNTELVQCCTSNSKYLINAQKKENWKNCVPLSPDTGLMDSAFKAAVLKEFKV